MLLPRLQPPLRAAVRAVASRTAPTAQQPALHDLLSHMHIAAPRRPALPLGGLTFVRHATHNAQSAANGVKDGPGKRLGAKKTGEEYVIPGNIIFRQRGTKWHPGENVGMGRDHTIYATTSGYVKYYRDPERHPTRKYIGIVFERDQVLPLPRNSPRRRKLGMTLEKIPPPAPAEDTPAEPTFTRIDTSGLAYDVKLRPNGYMYRESNWEIGRVAERNGVETRPFEPGNRWLAWRKRAARIKRNSERRGVMRKGAGKNKNKK